jgi:hypothetical protein
MASVGRAWTDEEINKAGYDEYGNPKPSLVTPTTATIAGGAGLTAVGARNWTDSGKVQRMTADRNATAKTKHAVNTGRLERAKEEARHQTTLKDNSRKGFGWLRHGKVRSTKFELEAASRAHDESKARMARNVEHSTPEAMASRAKGMKRGGKAMVAGGLTLAAAPVLTGAFRRKQQPVVIKADISKTITQARYGGNAEMGRAWRGPEKKDRKEPTIAVAGGAVGLGGGVAAVHGHRKLKSIKPAMDEVPAAGRHAHEAVRAQQATNLSTRSANSLEEAKRLDRDWRASTKSKPHPHAGQPAPDYPGHKRGPAGKVGNSGGGFQFLERHVGNTAAAHAREADFANTAHKVAGQELSGIQAHNASRAGRLKSATRLSRGGKGVAAVGGLTAIAAGIKAERDRKTGLGKPKRTRVAPQMSDAQRRANGL